MTNRKKIWNTIKDDFKSISFETDLKLDLYDMLDFYLSKEQKKELSLMPWYKKIYMVPLWLLKILFLKLSKFRRIFFVISIFFFVLFMINEDTKVDLNIFISIAVLFLILILELKDKLIAAEELKTGRIVQQAFTPEKHFSIPGWTGWLHSEPANSVGGDMIDAVKIDSERYGISLGDISGKELGAALYMVKLQSTLRAVVSDFDSLKELGEKINRIFFRDSESNRFATMVYMDIVPGSGEVKILNAGHMPPIIFRGDQVSEMERGGIALGLKKNAEYIEQHESLDPGDLIVLYSDGITEAKNSINRFFEKNRFISLIKNLQKEPLEIVGDAIMTNIKQFIGDAKVSDDISLILLRREK